MRPGGRQEAGQPRAGIRRRVGNFRPPFVCNFHPPLTRRPPQGRGSALQPLETSKMPLGRRAIVASAAEILRLKSSLREAGSIEGGWGHQYKDPDSSDSWEEGVLFDRFGVGPKYMMRLPKPSTSELLRLALESPYPDESTASLILLKNSSDGATELRRLGDVLETLAAKSPAPWERIATLVAWSGLEQPRNLTPTLNKSPKQVSTDYQVWADLSARLRRLRQQAESATGRVYSRDVAIFA